MCFSATASFTAAAVLGATGSFTMASALRKGLSRGECLMASFPLVFALQQAAEGLVWLGITGNLAPWLMPIGTYGFIFAAYVFWPLMGPVLGWMLEPPGIRRNIFAVLVAGGAGIAAYLAYAAISMPQTPMAMPEWGGHLWYMHKFVYIPNIETIYFVTACSALLLSSNRVAFWFAVVLTGAFIITMYGYNINVVPSVWCFYAAAASLVIVVGLLVPGSGRRLSEAR
ncbi:hypothetical protein KHP62_02960 [Rhodobacteraceae bacterium NNCM2]|nr:hypothetical protein [Coraliihabitans acroporae]